MINTKFLFDTSAWFCYFHNESDEVISIIDSEEIILISALSLFELKRKLLRDKVSRGKIDIVLEIVKKRSIIVEVTDHILELAAEDSIKYKLAAMDSIIYRASTTNNTTLITSDNDFKGLPNAKVVKVKSI